MSKKTKRPHKSIPPDTASLPKYRWLLWVQECLWLLTIFIIPLWFNPASEQLFEPDKLALFRALVGGQLLLLLVRTLQTRRWPEFSMLWFLPLLGVAGVATLSTVFASSPFLSLHGSYFRSAGLLTLWHFYGFFTVLVAGVRLPEQQRRLIYAITASALLVSAYGVIQALGMDPFPWRDMAFNDRVFSTLGQPNLLSGFLTLVLPFGLALTLHQQSKWQKTIGLLGLLLLIAVIILTRSRGGVLGLGAGLSAFAFFWGWRHHARTALVSLLITAIASGIAAALLWAPNPWQADLQKQFRLNAATSQTRLYFWRGAYQGILDRPLLGFGPDSMYHTFFPYYDERIANTEGPNVVPDRAHNWLLDLGYTQGVLGILAFLALLGTAFIVAWRALRRVDRVSALWLTAAMACLAAYLARGLVSFTTVSGEILFWSSLGLIAIITFAPTGSGKTKQPKIISSRWLPAWATNTWFSVGIVGLGLLILGSNYYRTVRADEVFHTGHLLENAGRSSEAISRYEEAIRLKPTQTYYAYALTGLYRGQHQAFPAAEPRWIDRADELLQRIEDQEGTNANLLLTKARHAQTRALTSGDAATYEIANQWFEKTTTLNPRQAIVRDEWGVMLMQAERFAQAEVQFERAAELFLNRDLELYHTIRAHLGGAYAYQGRHAEVIATIEPIFKPGRFRFDSFPARYFLANAYLEAGRLDDARKQAAKALPLAPSELAVRELQLRIELADTNKSAQKKAAEAVLRIDPDNVEARKLVR